MKTINQTIKDHWIKFAVLLLTVAGTIVSQAGPALADRIASAITGDRTTVAKMSVDCMRRDSLLLDRHNADVEKIAQSMDEYKRINAELIRKVDIYGAKIDGYFEAQRMMRDYSIVGNDSTCQYNKVANETKSN